MKKVKSYTTYILILFVLLFPFCSPSRSKVTFAEKDISKKLDSSKKSNNAKKNKKQKKNKSTAKKSPQKTKKQSSKKNPTQKLVKNDKKKNLSESEKSELESNYQEKSKEKEVNENELDVEEEEENIDKDEVEENEDEVEESEDDDGIEETQLTKKAKRKKYLSQLYQKYEKSFSKQRIGTGNPDKRLDSENLPSMNKKLDSLRKKISDKNSKSSSDDIFFSHYNELGYSIKIPKYFQQNKHNLQLWQFSYQKTSNLEIQFFIGVSNDPGFDMYKLLKQIKGNYNKLAEMNWSKTQKIGLERQKKMRVEKGIETSAEFKSEEYHNLFAIEVLENSTKNSFLIGILSVKRNSRNFNRILERYQKVFWRIYYSFAFL